MLKMVPVAQFNSISCYNCLLLLMDFCLFVLFALIRGGPSSKTHPESKCPELLANYCDMLLRKTPHSKKMTSEEIEKKLKSVVSVWERVGRVKWERVGHVK